MTQTKHINLIGCICFFIYTAMMIVNYYLPEFNLHLFLTGLMLEWCAVLFCFFLMSDESADLKNKIIIWCLLFQIPAFFCNTILDDDFYRYLWDGYVFWSAGNPYITVPAEYFSKIIPDEMTSILDLVSYPHMPTIYGPICQYVFFLAYFFRPHQIIFMKLLLMSANLILVCIVARIVNTRYLLLFAWCPLLIIETVYEIHIEILSVLFAMLAIYLTYFHQQSFRAKNILIVVFSACAIAAKLLALPILFFVLMKQSFKNWFLFLLIVVVLYLPFIHFHPTIDIQTLPGFLWHWRFNGSVFDMLNYFFSDFYSRLMCMGCFSLLFILIVRFNQNKVNGIPRGDVIYGLLFLLSPVVNPWYLLWLLLFAVIYSSLWAWTALMMVSFSYINGFYLNNTTLSLYQIPINIQMMEYGVVLFALCIDMFKKQKVIFT